MNLFKVAAIHRALLTFKGREAKRFHGRARTKAVASVHGEPLSKSGRTASALHGERELPSSTTAVGGDKHNKNLQPLPGGTLQSSFL